MARRALVYALHPCTPAQAAWHPGCSASYLAAGTCDISCGRCTPCAGYDYCHSCLDVPPAGTNFTCAQQARGTRSRQPSFTMLSGPFTALKPASCLHDVIRPTKC